MKRGIPTMASFSFFFFFAAFKLLYLLITFLLTNMNVLGLVCERFALFSATHSFLERFENNLYISL